MGRHLDELRTSLRSADLHLKAGSMVMLLVNHNDTLVNGSVGVVRGFTQCAKGTSTCIGTVTKTHKQKWPVVAFGTEHDVRVVVVGEHVWEKCSFRVKCRNGETSMNDCKMMSLDGHAVRSEEQRTSVVGVKTSGITQQNCCQRVCQKPYA